MTNGSADRERHADTPPILVLGLGNRLLGDDSVGLVLLERLRGNGFDQDHLVEFVDGGTQGIALLGYFANRKAIIILDAISRGDTPGTVHVLTRDKMLSLDCAANGATAHGGNVGDVLRAALLTNVAFEDIIAVGIEPECLDTRLHLSGPVQNAIAEATETARRSLVSLLNRWRVAGRPPTY